MPGFDTEIARMAQRLLIQGRPIDYHTGVIATKVVPGVPGVKPVTIELTDFKTKKVVDTLEVDACMVATGRAPYTNGEQRCVNSLGMTRHVSAEHAYGMRASSKMRAVCREPIGWQQGPSRLGADVQVSLQRVLCACVCSCRPQPGRHQLRDRQARLCASE